MVKVLLLVLGLPISAAAGFPPLQDTWFPEPPAAEKIAWEKDRTVFHNLKNQVTEWVRADAEWWSKFLLFVIALQALYIWLWA